MIIITENSELIKFANTLKDEQFITVDTEFSREKTYYPNLCLLQIASSKTAVIIDPLVNGLDLSPILEVFNNSNILKVFHSARQDLEIIYNLQNSLPKSIYDTQIAASVCGYGEFASYEQLIKKILKIQIDKSSRHSNWQARPLSKKQLAYALDDVIYLRKIYVELENKINKSGRKDWIKQELENLTNEEIYKINLDEVWKRIKFSSYSKEYTYLVKQLAKWREIKAQKLNLPRNHFLKEQIILELAATRPTSLSELRKGKNNLNLKEDMCIELIELIKTSTENKDAIAETKLKTEETEQIGENSLYALIRILLKFCAEKNHIAEKLITTSAELNKFIQDPSNSDISFLTGWRYDIFGKQAIEFLNGKIGFCVIDGKLEIKPLE